VYDAILGDGEASCQNFAENTHGLLLGQFSAFYDELSQCLSLAQLCDDVASPILFEDVFQRYHISILDCL
jgi:hypothetical protein